MFFKGTLLRSVSLLPGVYKDTPWCSGPVCGPWCSGPVDLNLARSPMRSQEAVGNVYQIYRATV